MLVVPMFGQKGGRGSEETKDIIGIGKTQLGVPDLGTPPVGRGV